MTLAQTVAAAHNADEAFDAALLAAGYKSRWDWKHGADDPAVVLAYFQKVAADEAMHKAFVASRVPA